MTTPRQRFGAFPEELIREVLVHVIDFPTDREFFSFHGDRSTRGAARWRTNGAQLQAPERRPPALLLVCKDWQRICTPLLYRTAIVRSKGQTESLTATLTTLRPELGVHVRRLRCEGAFGMDLYRLLKATTRLTHLALVLHVYANEGVSGLCRGLHLDHINPVVLVIADTMNRSKNRTKLLQTLEEVVPKWTKLEVIHATYCQDRWTTADSDISALFKRFSACPSLHTLVVPEDAQPNLDALKTLSRSRNLRRIFFSSDGSNRWGLSYYADKQELEKNEYIDTDPHLSALCLYDTPDGKRKTRPSRSEMWLGLQDSDEDNDAEEEEPAQTAPLPLLGHPEDVQEKIWRQIFYHIDALGYVGRNSSPALLSCAQVCQLFRRILVPDIYQSLSANSYKGTIALAYNIRRSPALRHHVRTLELNNYLNDEKFLDIHGLLEYTPNLQMLKGKPTNWATKNERGDALRLRWSTFTALAKIAANLTAISEVKIAKEYAAVPKAKAGEASEQPGTAASAVGGTSSVTPAASSTAPSTSTNFGHKKKPVKKEISVPVGPLHPFRALRLLHFDASVKLKFGKHDVPADIFPALESISFVSCHTSVMKLFAMCELPRLRSLALYSRAQTCQDAGDFLERHGPKVNDLDVAFFPTDSVLEMCTNLQSLRIRERKPPPSYTAENWRSQTLREIRFTSDMPAQIQAQRPWGPVFSSIDPEKLPRLKALKAGLSWPTDERSISGSFWVPYAEMLLEKGVEIQDFSGFPWTPRVRAHKNKRKRSQKDADEEE